jgi:hypothetical protein
VKAPGVNLVVFADWQRSLPPVNPLRFIMIDLLNFVPFYSPALLRIGKLIGE